MIFLHSTVNVVKILNPSHKKIKVPTQNTPQVFEFFHLTPQKKCRDQRKLTIITPRNCFQATPPKIELSMAITQMSKFKHETDDYGTFQSIPATSSRLLCLLSVRRSAFVPKIMCICDEKLYPTELCVQTSGDGFLFICIFQMIIELLEHINYSVYIIIYTLHEYILLLMHLRTAHMFTCKSRAEDVLCA